MNHRDLVEACHDAWGELHHAASLGGHLPEWRNEFEYHLFWECLNDEVRWATRELSTLIEEGWGWKLKFYSYGRSSATIAPSEWMNAAPGSSFGSLAAHKVLEGIGSGLEGYNADRKILAILEFMADYWHRRAEYAEEWWADMKEANGYDEMIADHDGKKLVTREVWV